MPWGNRNRFLRIFALLALIMQMVVSFGHVHASANQAARAETSALTCLDVTSGETAAPCPAPVNDDESDTTCLICLAAHQVAAAFLPAAPEIALPNIAALPLQPPQSAPSRSKTRAANFYARGPPRA